MAAAPADFRPADVAEHKIKKTADGSVPAVSLVQNPDILQTISHDRARAGQVIVGFAAETDPSLDAARAKLARKGCDLLVLNRVGDGHGFGAADNEWVVLAADGGATPVPRSSKDALAQVVLSLAAARLS